jgi:hypothetical protein
MADLLKDGARKPRILGGTCYTANSYDRNEVTERGVMPGMCYDLTISGNTSYTARLTEVEMLRTMQEWLTRYNAHQDQKRRHARVSA